MSFKSTRFLGVLPLLGVLCLCSGIGDAVYAQTVIECGGVTYEQNGSILWRSNAGGWSSHTLDGAVCCGGHLYIDKSRRNRFGGFRRAMPEAPRLQRDYATEVFPRVTVQNSACIDDEFYWFVGKHNSRRRTPEPWNVTYDYNFISHIIPDADPRGSNSFENLYFRWSGWSMCDCMIRTQSRTCISPVPGYWEDQNYCEGPDQQACPVEACGGEGEPAKKTNVDCETTTQTGSYGVCEGEFGPWSRVSHSRTYQGAECRTVSTVNSCGGGSQIEDCRPCTYEQEDLEPPTCESAVIWDEYPLRSTVLSCEDSNSGCDSSSYTVGEEIEGGGVMPARACDMAGNCTNCSVQGGDDTPPTCRATFFQPGRWHRDDAFEINGGPVRCWLESCEDPDPDGDGPEIASGCLNIPTGPDTPKEFALPGTNRVIEVEQDSLDPVHRDTCTIQVCDNAGNCSTCQSPEIAYDGTNVCRSSFGLCTGCDEDDDDCHCIGGDRSRCVDNRPVNCYTDPFDERCPGFDNLACLENNFIPGCPIFNPCYPETNRNHPRVDDPTCPEDAIRFCSRNPYHYGCNEACKFGLIDCDPEVPEGE